MQKRVLFVSVILVLLLSSLMPATAFAAKPAPEPFSASGSIAYITPGKVLSAGATDKWVVVERELGGSLSGSLDSVFVMNYHAMIESILTQAGTLKGTVTVGDHVLKVDGKVQPLEVVEAFPGVYLPKLTLGGKWQFTNATKGGGDLSAWLIFIPTPEGHVGTIVASSFALTGQWR